MWEDREERKESRNRKTEHKGPKEFFGTNLPHLLRLTEIEEVVRLNAVWAELTTASKSQQLLFLQQAPNKAAADLSLRAPTVVLSGEAEIHPQHHFQQCRCGDCCGLKCRVRSLTARELPLAVEGYLVCCISSAHTAFILSTSSTCVRRRR